MPKGRRKLYCLCRKPAEGFMIECDGCKDFFRAFNFNFSASIELAEWYCNNCSLVNRFRKLEEELNDRLAGLLGQINQDQRRLQDDTIPVVEEETGDSTIIEPEASLYKQNLCLKETNKHLINALCQATNDERALRQSAKKSSAQIELLQSEINRLEEQIKIFKNGTYKPNLILQETNKNLIVTLCQAAKDQRTLCQSAKNSSIQINLLQSEVNNLSDQVKSLKNRGRLSLTKK